MEKKQTRIRHMTIMRIHVVTRKESAQFNKWRDSRTSHQRHIFKGRDLLNELYENFKWPRSWKLLKALCESGCIIKGYGIWFNRRCVIYQLPKTYISINALRTAWDKYNNVQRIKNYQSHERN